MKTVKLLALAVVLAVSPACKKDKEKEVAKTPPPAPAPAPAPEPAPAPTPPPAPEPAAAPAPPAEDTADWIKIHASHFTKNDADPVEVKFETFKVVKATFDAKKIEGGTATIEIDLASLKTNDPKRDDHLKTPDYIDTKKFATATVDISNVKKKDDKT